MKVFVLGHRGMLGHVVARYLAEQGMEVITTNERYFGSAEDPVIAAVTNSNAHWIINTIGKLDAKTTTPSEMLLVNAQLPVHLKSYLRKNQRMIHASTDGVFSGRTGNYTVDAERDATDIYGFSKILGEVVAEPDRAYVVRTSIVGPSDSEDTGLMSWLLRQHAAVQGFTNHFWNGITTLEWSKLCAEIINNPAHFPQPLLQPGCDKTVTKYELLQLVAETCCRQIPVTPVEHAVRVDRALVPTHPRGSIRKQLEELAAWRQAGAASTAIY